MTIYLLDENVLRELRQGGNPQVRRWLASVAGSDLRISALTLFEKRRGAERPKTKNATKGEAILASIAAVEAEFAERIVPIDAAVAAEWARLLGAKDKNQRDRALAATARVYDFVLVTRNIADVRGCDVDVLDPFRSAPTVLRV